LVKFWSREGIGGLFDSGPQAEEGLLQAAEKWKCEGEGNWRKFNEILQVIGEDSSGAGAEWDHAYCDLLEKDPEAASFGPVQVDIPFHHHHRHQIERDGDGVGAFLI
jgi:hypothetical protein